MAKSSIPKNPKFTQETLQNTLSYDPDTGVFVWLIDRRGMPAGAEAGTISSHGYIQIQYDRRSYRGHRLAWLYMTGEWPVDQVDHRNRVRSDNRWLNLRSATSAQNHQNMGAAKASKSGLVGVSWDSGARIWIASIKVDRKTHYLGRFADKFVAHAKYLEAKNQMHPFASEAHSNV